MYHKASCKDFFLLVSFYHFFAGDSSALLNVSLKNNVVQKGQAIEIQVDGLSPDVKDKRFVSLECGGMPRRGTLIPFVKMVKKFNRFSILETSDYTERILTTGNNTIMITNATLLDEGVWFYCKLSFVHSNGSKHIPNEIVKYMKLKKVYGK